MNKLVTVVFALLGVATTFPAHSVNEPLQTPSAGKVDRHYLFSPQLNDTITIDVWTPEGFSVSRENKYPVIYMHDGQNLFDATTTWNRQSWEMDSVVNELVETNLIEAPVIVGIHSKSESRLGDLMPEKAFYMIENLPDTVAYEGHPIEVRGDRYAAFVAETLMPRMTSLYNLSELPGDTFVMGSSMGGLMSVYMISEYPELFGGAGCLSTHWPGDPFSGWPLMPAMLRYLDKSLPSSATHKLYFDHGTKDIDAFYGEAEKMVLDLIKRKGYEEGVNLEDFVDEGAGHQERFWSKRVYRPLVFLLSKR